MNTKEVSLLTGVSVRTLHHYDAIGLLSPMRKAENDYRNYSEDDLDTLQQILLFKACGFSLLEIKTMLHSPSFNRSDALLLQQKALLHEKQRIDTMLTTITRTLNSITGGTPMTKQEKFAGIDFLQNPYEHEARTLWGDKAINQTKSHLEELPKEDRLALSDTFDELFSWLSSIRHEQPDSTIAQEAMKKMHEYLNQNFGYHYTLDAFAGLGQMYVSDTRFTQSIDQYGTGLASFLSEAMQFYAQNNR